MCLRFVLNFLLIIQSFTFRLCHNKQSKVYLPEPPFPHAEVSLAAVSPASKEQRHIPEIFVFILCYQTITEVSPAS